MATMWRSNAVMYVTVPYNKVLFSICILLTSQSEVDFGIALVQIVDVVLSVCMYTLAIGIIPMTK